MKIKQIAYHVEKILEILGLDLTDPSLAKTPERVAKMYVEEVFQGLDPTTFPELTLHKETLASELVLIKNISLTSFCEHHLVPMVGVAHVAYLPKKGVLGLSKIHRLVRHFAKRPQLQERLTQQIADSLHKALGTDDIAVMIEAKHLCVVARGVEDQQSTLETHALRGVFSLNTPAREEFFMRVSEKSGRESKLDSVPTPR